MKFNIDQIEKHVNYIFSSYPNHDMINMSKAQTYWLINRVKELEEELQRDVVEEWELMKQNKRYRELLKDVFNALENYLHVFTNESDLIESAEHLSKQIYDALESESEWD